MEDLRRMIEMFSQRVIQDAATTPDVIARIQRIIDRAEREGLTGEDARYWIDQWLTDDQLVQGPLNDDAAAVLFAVYAVHAGARFDTDRKAWTPPAGSSVDDFERGYPEWLNAIKRRP